MTGPRNLHLVFSTPPAEIGAEQYNEWYDRHLYEILRTPGYCAARRYQLTGHGGSRPPIGKQFVSVYEIGDDLPQLAQDLAAERDQMDLPPWFDGIDFASWVAELCPEGQSPVLADRLWFEFSSEPAGVDPADYDGWHAQQLVEDCRVCAVAGGSRFRLFASNRAAAPGAVTQLALYEPAATAPERPTLVRDLERVPEWYGRIDVTSLSARAIGERVLTE